MCAGKGRQFKRREGKGEIILAPQAAALECLGPFRNWQLKRLYAPISSWELPEPGEQTLWQSQSELKADCPLIITRVLFRTGAKELMNPWQLSLVARGWAQVEPGLLIDKHEARR